MKIITKPKILQLIQYTIDKYKYVLKTPYDGTYNDWRCFIGRTDMCAFCQWSAGKNTFINPKDYLDHIEMKSVLPIECGDCPNRLPNSTEAVSCVDIPSVAKLVFGMMDKDYDENIKLRIAVLEKWKSKIVAQKAKTFVVTYLRELLKESEEDA
jgi:hypothetical protein